MAEGRPDMSDIYELHRTGPDREEGIRQLITNLQQQNRQLATDRDHYAGRLNGMTAEIRQLQEYVATLRDAIRYLWIAYLPDCSPDAALRSDALHPAWKPIAEYLRSDSTE